MKKLFAFFLAVILLSPTVICAEVTRYEFDKIIVKFSFEYSVTIGDDEKSGWIGDIAGDSGSLDIMFSRAELYNKNYTHPNGVDIIFIKGKYGERIFLANGCRVTDNQTVKLQLWSGITLDGLDVVKDYSEPLEIAYLEFYFSSDKIVSGVCTSFFAGDKNIWGVYEQIGNEKYINFDAVNYTGDLSAFLVNGWDINWDLISEYKYPVEKPPVDADVPFEDEDKYEDEKFEDESEEIIPDEDEDDDTEAVPDEDESDETEAVSDEEEDIVSDDRNEISDKLKELNLFFGTAAGYELDKPLTRAQAAAIIVRLMGEEAAVLQSDYPDNPFSDVPDSHWAKNYILWCYENDITKGTGETTFSPESIISSEEFLTLLMRLLGYESEPDTSLSDGVTITLFSSDYADRLEDSEEFIRGDAVDIIDKALITPLNTPEPILLAEKLLEREVFTHEQAVEAQLISDSEENVFEQINFFARSKLSR